MPKMLASIWPSRDENHGQNGHNLELYTGGSAAFCVQLLKFAINA